MSLTQLQERIRARKTPLALTLSPDPDRLSPKILKNFTDMFGDVPMARAEALRYHGTSLLDAAAGKLPAVVLRADAYLSQGMMGADVLSNLITAAHAKELYVILDVNAASAGTCTRTANPARPARISAPTAIRSLPVPTSSRTGTPAPTAVCASPYAAAAASPPRRSRWSATPLPPTPTTIPSGSAVRSRSAKTPWCAPASRPFPGRRWPIWP